MTNSKYQSILTIQLHDVLIRRFHCLEHVVIADFFEMYGRYLGVIAGMEFGYDCGNSLQEIRYTIVDSVDGDGKIHGSSYELKQDFVLEIGIEGR